MFMKKIDYLISPETKEFVNLCRRYFEYLEKMPDCEVSEFWTIMLEFLPEIYSNVSRLPQIDARYASEIEKFVTEREYNRTFANLCAYIGTLDKFSDFSDLGRPGIMKVIDASISETLTDIFQELKDFVLLYETGTLENMNDAIAECIDTFGQYWGVKLLSAARIIHINLHQHRYAEAKKASRKFDEFHDDDDIDDDLDEVDLEDVDLDLDMNMEFFDDEEMD